MSDSETTKPLLSKDKRSDKKPANRFRLSKTDRAIAITLVAGFIVLLLWPLTVFIVGPGDVGVLFRTLTTGTETKYVFGEGLGVKWPWNRIYQYQVRTQKQTNSVHGLASDGLRVQAEISVLYRPYEENAGALHQQIGPDYAERFVRPRSIEAVRTVIGQFDPHTLYQMNLDEIEEIILKELASMKQDLVDFQAVVVSNIILPASLNTAITDKLTQEQYALAYDYVLDQERKEAERKRIEAIGYQTFYSIVADALTPQLLTWRGIEATVELAESNNAKVVIVGGGKDQMPLILGSDIASQPDLPAPSAVDSSKFKLPDFNTLPPLFHDITRSGPDPSPRSVGRSSNIGNSPAPNDAVADTLSEYNTPALSGKDEGKDAPASPSKP